MMRSALKVDGQRRPRAAYAAGRGHTPAARRLRRRRGTEKVPFVAGDVEEHSDAAVGFGARCREKLHTSGCYPRVCSVEILDVKEETNAASGLPSDESGLIFPVSPREQQAGLRTWRADYYPPLGTPVVCQRRGVLHELEAQDVYEEADSGVVLADHDSDKAEMHGASIRAFVPGDSSQPGWLLSRPSQDGSCLG